MSGITTARNKPFVYDSFLLIVVSTLLMLGLIMLASASMPMSEKLAHDALFFTKRQGLFMSIGLLLSLLVTRIPLAAWQKVDRVLLLLGIVLLFLVLVPGIGHKVNGSQRWIRLGGFGLQVSELVKLSVIIFLSGYITRQQTQITTLLTGFIKPLSVIGLIAVLLLCEPDFGAIVVVTLTALGMLFLAGVHLRHFMAIIIAVFMLLAMLAVSSPYRWQRLTAFMNPWANQYDSGYQLTQSLIAFGRGEWLGLGLGSSIQKLFYLPEAHTDFLFAVMGEELGFVGLFCVIALFAMFAVRGFQIGRRAHKEGAIFPAFLAYGITLWLVLQTAINMGVNIGLLPTKGLTLPLMSYGGSSLIFSLVAVGILLRIHHEYQPVTNRRKG